MDPKYLLFMFIGAAGIFQLFKTDPQQAFFVICIVSIIVTFYVTNKETANDIIGKISNRIEDFTNDTSLSDAMPREIASRHYQVYKYPGSTKYSYRIKEYRALMQELEFVYIYDVEKLNHIKALGEAFFKTHFNVMMGKYEPGLYIGELHDFKNEILELMREFVYILPKVSTVVDIPDLDNFVEKKTLQFNELLSRYIRIVSHAYPDVVVSRTYEPPFESAA
jgi:hypothetical protein